MIPATPGPKIPENGPEPEFRPEFLRNSEPRSLNQESLPCTKIVIQYADNVIAIGNGE